MRGMATMRLDDTLDKFTYVWDTGWPWPALRAEQFQSQGNRGLNKSVYWAAPLGRTAVRWLHTQNDALPLRPQMAAFVGNTLFYATLVGTVTVGVGTARRLHRRGRGACERCGYDMGGLGEGATCPECGAQE